VARRRRIWASPLSVNVATLDGTDINYVGRLTATADLNDGRGVRNAKGAADFESPTPVAQPRCNGQGLTTVGAVIDAINTATGGAVVASVAAGSNGVT